LPLKFVAVVLLFGEPFFQRFFHALPRVENALTPFLIVFVVFSCYRYREYLEKRAVERGVAAIGLMSYGLYLWQQMFLADSSRYLHRSILDFAPPSAL